MALKFRGSSQIKDASISLSKIADVPSKTVLGRSLDSSGEMASLNSSNFRNVTELSSSDDVIFSTMSAETITASSELVSSDSLSVNGTDSAGLVVLSDTLTADGTGNVLNDAEVTGTMDALGSSNLNGGATVTGNVTTDTLTVNQTSTLTGNVSMDSALEAVEMTSSDVVISGKIDHNGLTSVTKFTSSNVDIDGGTSIGINAGIGQNYNLNNGDSLAALGTFTTLEATGNMTVDGNMTVLDSSNSTSLSTSNLKISDPLLVLGKDNESDSLDMGLLMTYGIAPDSTDAITNGDFSNYLNDWSTLVSGNSNWGISYDSTNVGARLKIGNGQTQPGSDNYGVLLYQAVEFTPASGKLYRFKIDIADNSLYDYAQIQLGFWSLSSTPTVSATAPIQNKSYNGISLSNGDTIESNYVDMSIAGLTDGFYIAIKGFHNQNANWMYTSYVIIDNVKLYEYDTTTQQEVEYTIPSTFGTAGILRDATSESGINKFKLFSSTEDLSSSSTVDFTDSALETATLSSHVEGNITFRDNIDISLSGDISGTAEFDGSSDVTITTVINNSSVQYDDVDFLSTNTDLDDGSGSSDEKISSELAIKTYVDAQVASGGTASADLEAYEIKMGSADSNGDVSFVRVKENVELLECDSSNSDISTEVITLPNNYDSEFVSMSKVFMNGQKLRYGASYDYVFQNDNELKINSDILTHGDKFEIRYFIASATSSSNDGGGGSALNLSNYTTIWGEYENNQSSWIDDPTKLVENDDFSNGIDGWDDNSSPAISGFGSGFTWDETNERNELYQDTSFGSSAYQAIATQETFYNYENATDYKVKANVYYDSNEITSSTNFNVKVWDPAVTPSATNHDHIQSTQVNTLTSGDQVTLTWTADSTFADGAIVGVSLSDDSGDNQALKVSFDNFIITDSNDNEITRTYSLAAYDSNNNQISSIDEGESITFVLTTTNLVNGTKVPFYVSTTLSQEDLTGVLKDQGAEYDSNGDLISVNDLSISSNSASFTMSTSNRSLCDGSEPLEVFIPHPILGEDQKLATVTVTINQIQDEWHRCNCPEEPPADCA